MNLFKFISKGGRLQKKKVFIAKVSLQVYD